MRRRTWVSALLLAVVGLVPTAAIAREDGPVVTLSEDTDVLIGQEIDVTVEGMPGGSTVTISTCWVLPVTSPNDCDLTDFGEYDITVDGNGTGTDIYVLPAGPAPRCTEEGDCFIVVSHGIGPQSIAGGAGIIYAAEQPEQSTTTVPETTTTVAETTTTVAETTTTVEETTTTVEETTTTEADTTTTTEDPEEESDGISTGAIVVIVLLAVGAGLVGFFVARNRGAAE